MEADIFQGTDLTNSTDSLALNSILPTNGSDNDTTGPNNPPHPSVQVIVLNLTFFSFIINLNKVVKNMK